MESVKDKFLRYVSVETTSDEQSTTQPSSDKELVLSGMIVDELKAMGISDAALDKDGYVMATIPSNIEENVPVTGFIAHVDTAPDASGKNVRPQIINCYDGGDIVLEGVPGLYLKPADFPELLQFKGKEIITTDGTTLLGADDKAGVAEIMYAAQYIMEHPQFRHGTVKLGFTPDEEIGRGVDFFDVNRFGADYAYTMDGGDAGELEYENFNAASAKVSIHGCNVHPGYAKGKMVNAILAALELAQMLPQEQKPQYTCGREGFFHITAINGNVEEASMSIIIRDHDRALFEKKKDIVTDAVAFLNSKYGKIITLELKDQYYNMREAIEPHYHIVDKAVKAMQMAGIEPRIQPVRGGTDGARLSFMGLPCPNIFAGGLNFHSKFEFVPVENMEKATAVILNLISLFAEQDAN